MISRHPRWALVIATGAGTISVFAFVVLPAVLVSTIGACSAGANPPVGNAAWLATAYGPPWGGIQGNGVTATGINLTGGQPMLEVAVDPSLIPLRTFVHVQPNPFDTPGAFYAGDTGGAIVGQHVDIYDWRGRAEQDAWGARQVTVTPAADPGAGNALEQVQAPALVPLANQCASAGGYQNPFAHAAAIVPERIDMGVDYTASGPIDALGDGIVTYSQAEGAGWGPYSCSGGHGGAVVYRLADGPDQGRFVYVTEGIIPAVQVGQQISGGQPVATFTGCIEIGWGTGTGDQPMAAALGQACTGGDAGCHSTWCGLNMSQLIAATGGPAGVLQPGELVGSGC
jgi:3D (Asp-Asp-Asp) domain-containing protein